MVTVAIAVIIGLLLLIGLLFSTIHVYIRTGPEGNSIHIRFLKMFRLKLGKKGLGHSSGNLLMSLSGMHSGAGVIDVRNSSIRHVMIQAAEKSWPAIKSLLGRIKISTDLRLEFHLSDPYTTAVMHGLMEAAVGCLYSLVCSLVKKLDFQLKIIPIFNNKSSGFEGSVWISCRLVFIFIAMIRLLPVLLRFRKNLNKGSVCDGPSN